MARVKWHFSKQEYLQMTLREYAAFRDIENPPEEELVYADDVF